MAPARPLPFHKLFLFSLVNVLIVILVWKCNNGRSTKRKTTLHALLCGTTLFISYIDKNVT